MSRNPPSSHSVPSEKTGPGTRTWTKNKAMGTGTLTRPNP